MYVQARLYFGQYKLVDVCPFYDKNSSMEEQESKLRLVAKKHVIKIYKFIKFMHAKKK